jgi:hypothetical protein
MARNPEKTKHIKEVVVHETWELLGIAAFLAAFFVSLTTYRRLLMEEYHIAYYEYGYAIVESLVLAKVILLGEAFHLGEHYRDASLIVSTLWKTLVFGILVVLFSILEHFVGAVIDGKSLASVAAQLTGGPHLYELLARAQVTLVALVPLFAFREVGRVMGPGKLSRLFFKRSSTPSAESPSTISP